MKIDDLISTSEFAELVDSYPQKILHYAKKGIFESRQIGRYWFIHRKHLLLWPTECGEPGRCRTKKPAKPKQ